MIKNRPNFRITFPSAIWIGAIVMATACTPLAREAVNPSVTQKVSLPTGYPVPIQATQTMSPYVAPAPQTAMPPAIPLPTSTPIIPSVLVISSGRTIDGTGDFPSIELIAPSLSNATTPALFRVEKNQATEFLTFQGLNRDDAISLQLSPDRQHEAILEPGLENNPMKLGILSEGNSTFADVYTARGSLNPSEKGSAYETITSMVWADNAHLYYTRVVYPGVAVTEDVLKQGLPLPLKSEVWSSSVDGKDQKLIASGSFYRLLGISPNGKHLYVTRIIDATWNLEGFSIFDLDTLKMTNLWPAEQKPEPYYYQMRLITLPDGACRVLFTYVEQGPGGTVLGKMPVVYLGDAESGKSEVIWSGKNNGQLPKDAKGFTSYEAPTDILWAPDGSDRFIYKLQAEGELWQSDLTTGNEKKLGKVDGDLIAWTKKGIVTRNRITGVLGLLDENGNLIGKIQF